MKLSVVIRCRNEAATLHQVLESLRLQECDFEWEIIVVDNESSDNSIEIARDYGAHIVSISTAEFTYGRALNLGFSKARGELVMPLSAHTLLIGTSCLAEAVKPFNDPQVAGARCIAIDSSGRLANWFKPVDLQKPEFHVEHSSAVPVFDPAQWQGKRHLSNTCSVIRKAVWEQIPFSESIEAAEDRLWSQQALESGYKIHHCAACLYLYNRVLSSKTRRQRQERNLVAAYRTGLVSPLSFPAMLKRIAKALVAALRLGKQAAQTHAQDEVHTALYLYHLPKHAKKIQRGSLPEYEKKAK